MIGQVATQWHYLSRSILILLQSTLNYFDLQVDDTFCWSSRCQGVCWLEWFLLQWIATGNHPSTILITSYHPDLILYNSRSSLMGIIELTCMPSQHSTTPRVCSSSKVYYFQNPMSDLFWIKWQEQQFLHLRESFLGGTVRNGLPTLMARPGLYKV